MCACDGIEPLDALARSHGGYCRQVNEIRKKRKQDGTTTDMDTGRTRNKKKKVQSHFKRVGWMRESPVTPRATKPKTNKKKEDSDLEYVDGLDTATRVNSDSTAIATIVDTIDDRQSTGEFTHKIETTECSSMNNARKKPLSTTNKKNDSRNNVASRRGKKHLLLRKSIRSELLEEVRDCCFYNL